MVGIGYVSPQPWVEVHGYHFLIGSIGNIDIFHTHIHLWLKIAQSLCYLTLGVVRHLLTQYLQGRRRHSKDETSTFSVQKGASRMHAVF